MTAILPDTTKNALLNSAATNGFVTSGSHLALFTAFPPIIGTNEVTGGSPAYARKVITFTASAAAGSISPATGLPATFDVPAGTTVKAVGVCTALTAGSLLAWLPAGSVARRAFSVDAGGVTADQLDAPGHGLSVNDQIIVWASIGAALPAGMAEDTIYFVKTVVDADTIELSATQGGAILPITGVGDGDLQKFTPEVFAGQGTYQVSSYPISLPG